MKRINENIPAEVISIYDVEDFSIGHDADTENITGCTVIVCNNREKATAGSDVRGGAPGTRNLDLIKPQSSFESCSAVVLSGGSCFGLNAAGGVEKCLEEKGIGIDFVSVILPVVVQAIIFDLEVGSSAARPDFDMGYRACQNAFKRERHPDGNIGGGIGASCGKMLGPDRGMKTGLGTYCLRKGELFVGAVMVVNPGGDVCNPATGQILAGALDETKTAFANSEKTILNRFGSDDSLSGNTTIGCVITNAALTRSQAHKIAAWSHDGLARSIRPVHTMLDGDTMFCMASGEVEASMLLIGTMAVTAVENAIANAARHAEPLGGLKCMKDIIA